MKKTLTTIRHLVGSALVLTGMKLLGHDVDDDPPSMDFEDDGPQPFPAVTYSRAAAEMKNPPPLDIPTKPETKSGRAKKRTADEEA